MKTYNVAANWTEGVGAAHVQVRAVETQQNLDVIEAIGLVEKGWEGKKNMSGVFLT